MAAVVHADSVDSALRWAADAVRKMVSMGVSFAHLFGVFLTISSSFSGILTPEHASYFWATALNVVPYGETGH